MRKPVLTLPLQPIVERPGESILGKRDVPEPELNEYQVLEIMDKKIAEENEKSYNENNLNPDGVDFGFDDDNAIN